MRETWYFSENPAQSGIRNKMAGSNIGKANHCATSLSVLRLFIFGESNCFSDTQHRYIVSSVVSSMIIILTFIKVIFIDNVRENLHLTPDRSMVEIQTVSYPCYLNYYYTTRLIMVILVALVYLTTPLFLTLTGECEDMWDDGTVQWGFVSNDERHGDAMWWYESNVAQSNVVVCSWLQTSLLTFIIISLEFMWS